MRARRLTAAAAAVALTTGVGLSVGTVTGAGAGGAERGGSPILVENAVAQVDGDVDVAVLWWQEELNTWLSLTGSDHHPVPEDGVFGEATEAATVEFQNSYPGLEATGSVTGLDRVALESAIAHLS